MEINGVAHTFITAGDFAKSRAFYAQLLPFLGLTVVADTGNTFYCVGGRTGFGIHAPAAEHAGTALPARRASACTTIAGAPAAEDVDEAHAFLTKIGAHIVHAPQPDNFAPGYYSVLFEDPDGTRLEINHVPGRGLLAPGTRIGGGYQRRHAERLAEALHQNVLLFQRRHRGQIVPRHDVDVRLCALERVQRRELTSTASRSSCRNSQVASRARSRTVSMLRIVHATSPTNRNSCPSARFT